MKQYTVLLSALLAAGIFASCQKTAIAPDSGSGNTSTEFVYAQEPADGARGGERIAVREQRPDQRRDGVRNVRDVRTRDEDVRGRDERRGERVFVREQRSDERREGVRNVRDARTRDEDVRDRGERRGERVFVREQRSDRGRDGVRHDRRVRTRDDDGRGR